MKHSMVRGALVALTLLVATSTGAPRAAAEAMKFGVVDVEEVFQKTEQGRKAVEKWKAYREKTEKEAQEKLLPLKEQLEAKIAEFQKQMETMKPEAREKKQELLQQKYKELMEQAKKYEQEAQKQYEKIMGPIQKKMEEVLYDMGIKGQYTLILRKADAIVLFATSKIDITEDVIREFNARK
jgi:outer membrane protein